MEISIGKGGVRGRFAPTPSGLLHIGHAWTALWAWALVRRAGGAFVLRIEDLDTARCKPAYVEACLADLRWLGIDWDEGPDIGGPCGPYRQRDRQALYEQAVAQLAAAGRLYPCFCSRAELARLAHAPHGLAGDPVYPGTCRHLTADELAERAQRKPPSLRFIMPAKVWRFEDGIMGPQRYDPPAGGDFVVRRADGVMAYQLAVVVDDAAMGVSEVVRGADLLDSTPRQLALYEALGLRPPAFSHVPLICDEQGRRLAKRDGDLALASLRQRGGPQALIGWLAWVGGLIAQPEPMTAHEALAVFVRERAPREAVRFSNLHLRQLLQRYGMA